MSVQQWAAASVFGQDHPPITQIPALLDHVQNVGFSAGASQAGEKEHCRPGGRVGISEAAIVVKPIHRYLSSICCLNKLTAEKRERERCNSAAWLVLKMTSHQHPYVSVSLLQVRDPKTLSFPTSIVFQNLTSITQYQIHL